MVPTLVMPQMSGHDLALGIRSVLSGTRFMLMSGYADDVLGGDGLLEETVFVAKPFTPDGLARKVREALSSPGGST